MLSPIALMPLALLGALLLAGLILLLALSRHKKGARRELDLMGRVGSVVTALRPEGAVLVDGELWRARVRSGGELARGRVRVVGARGVVLEVEAVS